MSIITKLTWINDSINIGEQIIYVRHDDEERFIAGRVGASGRLYLDDLTDLEPRPDEATYQVSSVLELNTGETIEKISDELTLEVPPALPEIDGLIVECGTTEVPVKDTILSEIAYQYKFTSPKKVTRFDLSLFKVYVDGRLLGGIASAEATDTGAIFTSEPLVISADTQPMGDTDIEVRIEFDDIELYSTPRKHAVTCVVAFEAGEGQVSGTYNQVPTRVVLLDGDKVPLYDIYSMSGSATSWSARIETEGTYYAVFCKPAISRQAFLYGAGLIDIIEIRGNQEIFSGLRFYSPFATGFTSTNLTKLSLTTLPEWYYDASGMMKHTYVDTIGFKIHSGVRSMANMLSYNRGYNGDMSGWDTRNVTNMSGFMENNYHCAGFGIAQWDVGKVTALTYFFYYNTYRVAEGEEDPAAGIKYWVLPSLLSSARMFESSTRCIDVSGWDCPKLNDISNMFRSHKTYNIPLGTWKMPSLRNLSNVFNGALLFNQNINDWDVSQVTQFNHVFNAAESYNQPLDKWDVSQSTTFINMFNGCTAFNQSLNSWNVSKCKTFAAMFNNCVVFDQPLDKWVPNEATEMGSMFSSCASFTHDISTWCVPLIISRPQYFSQRSQTSGLDPSWGTCPLRDDLGDGYSFRANVGDYTLKTVGITGDIYVNGVLIEAEEFTVETAGIITIATPQGEGGGSISITGPITEWFRYPEKEHGVNNIRFIECTSLTKVPAVKPEYLTDMSCMFKGCKAFNQNINDWDISKVTSLAECFAACTTFNQPLDKWNTANVTTLYMTFLNCHVFAQDISMWNVSNVTTLEQTFYHAYMFNSELNDWDISKVTTLYFTFSNTKTFNQPLDKWDTSNVVNMGDTFSVSIFNQSIDSWDVRKVTTIKGIFYYNPVYNQPMNSWLTESLEQCGNAFTACYLFNQPLNKWQMGKVKAVTYMFQNAQAFNQSLSNWDVSNVTSFKGCFYNAYALTNHVWSWNVENGVDFSYMFYGCKQISNYYNDWKVSNAEIMSYMFYQAEVNDRTMLHNWCVSKILSRPTEFSTSIPAHDEPIWGTCPAKLHDGNTTTILHAANTPLKIICGPNDVITNNGISVITVQIEGEHYEANFTPIAGLVNVAHGDTTEERTLSFISRGIVEIKGYHLNHQGNVIGFRFNSETEELYPLRSIDLQVPAYVTSTAYMFKGMSKFNPTSTGGVDFYLLDSVTTTEGMFYGCTSLRYASKNYFGKVLNTSYMYYGCGNLTSGTERSAAVAENTDHMFDGCTKLTNLNIALNSYSEVKSARYMFRGCETLTAMNTSVLLSNCEDMTGMFEGCISFNDSTVSKFQTGKVRSFKDTFKGCVKLNQPLSNWDVGSAENMDGMFYNAELFNHDLTGWCVKYVMSEPPNFGTNSVLPEKYYPMWGSCPINGYLPIKFDFSVTPGIEYTLTVSSGIEMIDWGDGTITRLTDLITPHTHTYTTSGVYRVTMHPTDNALVSFSQEGGNITVLTPLPILNVVQWGTANWGKAEIGNSLLNSVPYTQPPFKNYDRMFKGSTVFNQNIEHWDMTIGVSVVEMFANCTAYNSSLAGWDVSRITDFRYLFSGCTSFNQPLADWDVESATDMEGMFYACAIYNQDLSGWCVTNILSEPGNFRTNGVLSDDNTPIWGSCPSKYGLPMIVVKNVTTRLTNTVPLQQNAINMIDWGDGNISYSDGLNPIEYTYASAGIYTVKIYARLGNKLYIDGGMLVDVQEVVQWCSEGNSYIYFGSDLLTKVPNKAPPKTTSYYDLFRNCSIFNQNINDWDTSGVNNMNGVFRNASSFNQPLDKWDTSKVTNLSSVFTGATAFNQNINTWNTSKAMTLVQIFSDAVNFNQPLNNWDVSQVTSLSSAFYNAAKFNQPLDKWNTGKVVDMGGTFRNAVAFNQNLNTWNVENVSSFLTMFAGAVAFDQPLNNWKTPNATSVRAMFSGATAFNHDISNFDVSKCTDFTNVLYGCTYFNHPMNDWDVSSAKTLSNMFYGCASFDQPLDKWDLSSCTHLDYMFSLSAFNHPIDMWDVTQVTNFRAMFEKNVVFDKPLANWDVISATNMISMFNGATAFDSSLAIWCVTGIISRPSNFSNMVESKEPVWGTCPKRVDMFTATLNIDTVNTVVSFADGAVVGIIDWGDGQQTNVGVTTHTYISRGTFTVTIHPVEGSKLAISKLSGSEWISVERWGESAFSAIHLESSKLTSVPDVAPDLDNFSGMFRRCTSFNDVAVTKWDMSKAVYTNDMFEECALFDQDISGWDMSNVVNVNGMFRGCTGFKQVLASWRLTSVTTCTYMFERAVTTCNLDMSQWGLTNTTTAKGMFLNSGLVDNGISTCGIGLKCTDLSSTFEGCAKFVGDVSNWEVVNVTDMTKLFKGCTLFNVDIGKWDVEGCLAMDYMFQSTTVFNQDLSTWCVMHILTQPTGFRLSSALKDSFTPIWGTCPLKADPLVVKLNTSSKKEFTIVANSNLVAVTVSGVGSFYPAKANALITFTIPDDMDSVNVFMYPEVNTQINLPYGSANQLPITEVIQWPSNGFVVAYLGNPELTKVPDFPPPNTTSLAHLFRNASSFVQDVTGWDVSKVTSFSYMFSGCSLFNQAVGSWTTTNCTDTSYMFQNCPLFNQPLASWNMAKVITTTYMFQNCKVFNQPIGGWNMAKNKSLAFMFNGCSAFNQPLNTWNVSAVTHFGSIFKDAVAFDQPLDKWNTVSALVASSTFSGATAFNQDISGWNMSKTTNFGNMFEYAVNFNQPIGKWSVMSAIGMGYMFRGATKFSQDLSSWCVTKFTDAPSGFSVNSGLTDAQLPVWGTCPNGV